MIHYLNIIIYLVYFPDYLTMSLLFLIKYQKSELRRVRFDGFVVSSS